MLYINSMRYEYNDVDYLVKYKIYSDGWDDIVEFHLFDEETGDTLQYDDLSTELQLKIQNLILNKEGI